MTFGQLMAFVRERIRGDVRRNGSILKALCKRWPAGDVEAMVRGAALLGWNDLRSLNARDGVGRRWAIAAHWQAENHKPAPLPQSLKDIFRALGES